MEIFYEPAKFWSEPGTVFFVVRVLLLLLSEGVKKGINCVLSPAEADGDGLL